MTDRTKMLRVNPKEAFFWAAQPFVKGVRMTKGALKAVFVPRSDAEIGGAIVGLVGGAAAFGGFFLYAASFCSNEYINIIQPRIVCSSSFAVDTYNFYKTNHWAVHLGLIAAGWPVGKALGQAKQFLKSSYYEGRELAQFTHHHGPRLQ